MIGRQILTYGQLATAAAKAANLIQNLGLSRGDDVVWALRPRAELVAGILGTILFGAVPRVVEPGDCSDLRDARMLFVEAEEKPAIDARRREFPDLWHVVVLVRSKATYSMGAGDFLWDDYYDPASDRFQARPAAAAVVPELVAPLLSGGTITLRGIPVSSSFPDPR